MTWITLELGHTLRHIRERTRSVLSGIPTRSVGTISVISSTPIMPMLLLGVIPESYCDHGYVFSQILLFWPRFAPLPDCAYHDERGLKRSGRRLLLWSQHNRQVPQVIHLNAEALP